MFHVDGQPSGVLKSETNLPLIPAPTFFFPPMARSFPATSRKTHIIPIYEGCRGLTKMTSLLGRRNKASLYSDATLREYRLLGGSRSQGTCQAPNDRKVSEGLAFLIGCGPVLAIPSELQNVNKYSTLPFDNLKGPYYMPSYSASPAKPLQEKSRPLVPSGIVLRQTILPAHNL